MARGNCLKNGKWIKSMKSRITKLINYVSPGYIGVPSRYYYKLLGGTPYYTSKYASTHRYIHLRMHSFKVSHAPLWLKVHPLFEHQSRKEHVQRMGHLSHRDIDKKVKTTNEVTTTKNKTTTTRMQIPVLQLLPTKNCWYSPYWFPIKYLLPYWLI